MLATRHDARSITPAIYANAVRALGPSIAATQPDSAVALKPGRVLFPRIAVRLSALRFELVSLRARDGSLWFFAQGPMVLLPSCSRGHAREIVSMFVSILDGYARAS